MSTFQLWAPAVLMLVLLALQTPVTWSMAIAALGFFALNMGEMPLANFAPYTKVAGTHCVPSQRHCPSGLSCPVTARRRRGCWSRSGRAR